MADHEEPTSDVGMEASGRLAGGGWSLMAGRTVAVWITRKVLFCLDSWVDVVQGEAQKDEGAGESREEEVERLLAEATSGEESDVQ